MPTEAVPSPPVRRGACPGVLDPMESADGWLVRIRLPAGRLAIRQLGVVAELAARYGSGVVEVTSRANLQLRGIAEAGLDEVGNRLVEAALAASDPAADARRAVVASPLAGHDPTEATDVSSTVDAVLQGLAAADLPPLPAKFGVVIDGGGQAGVRGIAATICLGAVRADDGTAHWHVAHDSSLAAGPTIPLGPLPAAALADAVLTAATIASPGRRFRHPPEAVPADPLLTATTASPGGRFRHPPEAVRTVGVLTHTMPGRSNVVAQAFLGRMDVATLAAVAELATRGMAVRTAPGGLALLGVPDAEVATIVDALGDLGLVVHEADDRLGVSACIGAPGCAAARADTAVAAARLAASRAARRPVHLAACEKRCGAPFGATVLVADERGHFAAVGTP